MTASEVIEQIKTLPPEERAEVECYIQSHRSDSTEAVSPEVKEFTQRNLHKYDNLFRKLAQ
ncbi:MAG: hypothetical protein OSB29_01900 [Verrucomicrobiota bacterium]|nr:hypothetical protein [Verrucomicrobiota bacterium]